MKLTFVSIIGLLTAQLAAFAVPSHNPGGLRIIEHPDPEKRALLQNLVRWSPILALSCTNIAR